MLTRRTVLLAKVETTYGQDASPSTSNAILCTNPELTADGKILTRDFVRDTISRMPHSIGRILVDVKFTTEMKGSGDASSSTSIIPEVAPLLRASGLSQTIQGASAPYTALYSPISTNFESATIYIYYDGLLHKITGCRGTFDCEMVAGEYGKFNWTMRGLYQTPIDASMISGVYQTSKPPILENLNLTIGTFSPVAKDFKFSLDNTLAEREDLNSPKGLKEIMITSRDPKGSIDPESVTNATYEFWSNWENATEQSLSFIVGTATGDKFQITSSKVTFSSLKYADRNGLRVFDAGLTFAGSDDEFVIKFM